MTRSGGVVVAGLVCLLVGGADAKTKAAPKENPVKAVKAVIKKHVDSFQQRGSGGETNRDDWSWYRDDAEFYVESADESSLGASSLEDYASNGPLLLTYGGKLDKVKVMVAADGQSAWATFLASGRGNCVHDDCTKGETFRVTELLVKVEGTWVIQAGMWSIGLPDKQVHAAAMDGTAPVPAEPADPNAEGDSSTEGAEELLTAIAAPLRKGAPFADLISDRADFELFGTAPGERIAGGKGFRKAWKAWAPTLSVEGKVRAGLAPSGTVGWVGANLKIGKTKGKKSYSVFVRAFFVVEKGKDGWRVVSVHLAVPRPGDNI